MSDTQVDESQAGENQAGENVADANPEAAADQARTADRGSRSAVMGIVVSAKMDKTIIVRRDRKVLHPLYKKYVRRSTRYVAHDEANTAHLGDEVEIVETRPISKTKRWRLVNVLREAPRGDGPTEKAPAARDGAAEGGSAEVQS